MVVEKATLAPATEEIQFKVLNKDVKLVKQQFDSEIDVTFTMTEEDLSVKILDVSLLKADAEYESDYLKLQEEVTYANLHKLKTVELSDGASKKPTVSDIENAVKATEEYQIVYLKRLEAIKHAKYLQSILFDLIAKREKYTKQ